MTDAVREVTRAKCLRHCRHAKRWEKSIGGRGYSKYGGLEVGTSAQRGSRGASMAGVWWKRLQSQLPRGQAGQAGQADQAQ